MTYLGHMSVAHAQEAAALMFHHLRLAAILFEATDLNVRPPADEFSAPAITAWLGAMNALYPEED